MLKAGYYEAHIHSPSVWKVEEGGMPQILYRGKETESVSFLT